MNGTSLGENFPLLGIGGCGGRGACADCVGVGDGLGADDGEDFGSSALVEAVSFSGDASSSLVKYRKPATQIATTETTPTTTGHIQAGAPPAAAFGGGFLACGCA